MKDWTGYAIHLTDKEKVLFMNLHNLKTEQEVRTKLQEIIDEYLLNEVKGLWG